jgi:DNA-binding MurR/RpiR family transcriptional regulator
MESYKSMGSITNTLLNYINTASRSDNYYDIAKNILNNINKIEQININDLAELCYVSPATISRFCRDIGFDNFQEFKKVAAINYSIDTDYSRVFLGLSKEKPEEAIENYTSSVFENIKYAFEKISIESLNKLAKDIHDSKSVAFFGIQFLYNMGLHLQSRLIIMGKFMQAERSYEQQLHCAQNLDKNSLAIIVSVEGSYFYRFTEIVDELKRNGVRIVLITQNLNSKFANMVDEVIVCGKSNSENEGRFAVLYIIEVLVARYAALYS